jgi:hypothetical protein
MKGQTPPMVKVGTARGMVDPGARAVSRAITTAPT